jgi:Helix-turn-helix domain
MDPKNQPAYPLFEALLYDKGLTLQATYTNADVASLFGVTVRTIQSRAADGSLPSRKLIGRARFLPTDLESFLVGSKKSDDV